MIKFFYNLSGSLNVLANKSRQLVGNTGTDPAKCIGEYLKNNIHTVERTGTMGFEASTQVTVKVQAKNSSRNSVTIGGENYMIQITNKGSRFKTSLFGKQDTNLEQVFYDEIYEQMADHGNGTYSYDYTINLNGTITISVFMLAGNGMYTEYYDKASGSTIPLQTTIEPTLNFNWRNDVIFNGQDSYIKFRLRNTSCIL